MNPQGVVADGVSVHLEQNPTTRAITQENIQTQEMGTIIETVTFLGGEKLEMLIVQRWTLKTSIPSQVLTEIRWTVAVESGQRTIGGVDVDEILEAELAAHPVLKTQTTLYLSHRTRCSMASTRCCGRTAEEAPEAPVPLPLETIKYFSLEVVRRLQS